jgi:hypothetical protein
MTDPWAGHPLLTDVFRVPKRHTAPATPMVLEAPASEGSTNDPTWLDLGRTRALRLLEWQRTHTLPSQCTTGRSDGTRCTRRAVEDGMCKRCIRVHDAMVARREPGRHRSIQ